MRVDRSGLVLLALLLLGSLLGVARPASAQVVGGKPPRPFVCQPGQPGCYTYPPSLSISPGTETVSSSRSLSVTITYCDSSAVASHTIKYNNTDVTSSWSYGTVTGQPGCHARYQATGTVTLNLGANTLYSQVISSVFGNVDTASQTVTYTYVPPATVTVTPKSTAPTNVATGLTLKQVFMIASTEGASDVANLACGFTANSAITSCSGKLILTVPANSSVPDTVTYVIGSKLGNAQLNLTATMTNNLAHDEGYIEINALNRIRSLKVAAVSPTMHAPPSTAIKIPFVVTNSGNLADTVSLSSTCTGAAVGTCTLQTASLPIPANTSIGDTISTTTASASPATAIARLTGYLTTATSIRDSAYTTVVDTATPGIGIDVASQNPSSIRVPDACVAIAIRRGVANQCGDLRMAHALPAVRSYSRVRAPVLLYNSGLANPSPLLRIRVVLDATKGTPDSVHAIVSSGGVTFGTNSWTALAARQTLATGRPQLLAVRLSGLEASEYTLSVEVDAFYGTTKVPYTTTDYMANASADSSHLGAGWTISGVEALHVYSCKCSFFWSSSDGEGRFYYRQDTITAHRFIFTAPSFDRPDTLTFDSVHQIYTRLAEHRLLVQFNTAGQHIRTITRLGDTTKFYYRNQTDLDSIVVPTPQSQLGDTSGFKYAFTWNTTTGLLSSITAPSLPGQTRTVTFGRDGSNRLTTITDPDNTVETTGYGTGALANVATSMIEKRGTNLTFAYDAGQKLNQVIIDPGSYPHINVKRTFIDAQSRPLAGPVIQDSLYMFYGGPRYNSSDSADVMSLWVDKYDEPYTIVDGHGSSAVLARANQYPALVTRSQYPNGRIVGATYDGRGNLASETDSTHTLNGKYATTRYEFDQKWDFVTKVARPDSDSTAFAYDPTLGNRQWQQVGPSSNTRVIFNYYPSGTAAAGLLSSVQTPVEGASHTTTVTYSTLANDSTTTTPVGFTTIDRSDPLGRTIRVTSPIDSAATHWRVDSTGYDIMDRVTWQRSYGPGDTSNFHPYFPTGNLKQFVAPAETLLVRTYYASPSNGVPDSVSRQALPDSNTIGTMTTRYTRDALDRAYIVIQPDSLQDYYTFDAAGNTIGQITRRSFELAMRYDALNHLIYRFAPQPEAFQDTTIQPGGINFPRYMNCGLAYCLPADTATFAYDKMGQMILANNQTARISRTYNLDGTLATDTMRVVNMGTGDFTTHVYGLGYTYDLDSRRYQLFQPTTLAPIINGVSWNSQTYGFNSLNQLITETDVVGNLFSFSYDNDVRVYRVSSAGTAETSTFDLDGRVIVRTDSTADVQPNLDGWASHEIRHDNMHYDARDKMTAVSGLTDQGYQRYSALGTLIHGLVIGPSTHPANWAFDYWEEMYLPDAMGNVRWKWNTGGKSSNYTDSLHTVRRSLYRPHTGRLTTTDYYYQGGLQVAPFDTESFYYDFGGNRTTSWTGRSGPTTYQSWFIPTQFYYDALEHLRITDKFTCMYDASLGYCAAHEFQVTATDEPRFEEYYYDALGRRVLVRSRDDSIPCDVKTFSGQDACFGSIERTVYDGNMVLYDIRMPGDDSVPAARLERDTGGVNTYPGVLRGAPYGRVAYTNGLAIDAPLDVIRIGYDSTWPGPVPIVPIADWKGAYMTGTYWGTYGGPGADSLCANQADYGVSYGSCVIFLWPGPKYGYWRQDTYSAGLLVTPWLGHVIEGGRDVSNLLYRRNRYVDPQTQTFTQEDPIGLAGGVNAYGFADGDPVDYSDPFGLCPPCTDAELMWLGHDILQRTGGLDAMHIGGGIRVNKLRTTVNLKPLSGIEVTQSICPNCMTPVSAEGHVGVDVRHQPKGEPDLTVSFENGVSVNNKGFDFGVSTPEGCVGPCVDVGVPKSEGQEGVPAPGLRSQSDATSKRVYPPARVEPAGGLRRLEPVVDP